MPSVSRIKLSLIILLLGCTNPIKAQVVYGVEGTAYMPTQKGTCLSEVDRQQINQKLKEQLEFFRNEHLIPSATLRDATLLGWPLQANSSYRGFDYHTITNYVDHNLSYPNQVQDHNCNNRTYDTPDGYNHSGTDFSLWPKPWELMENDAVEVIAAERGVILEKQDGYFDKSCSLNNKESWNAIYILHADGSIAWYGHLKKNSLTGKTVGAVIERGEYLGIVGSSGASTAPHLHFELHDADGNILDPFAGSCNGTVDETWWLEQKAYNDPSINLLAVEKALPEESLCAEPNLLSDTTILYANDEVFFIAYLRDQQRGQILEHSIIQPDNLLFKSWESSLPDGQSDFFSASLMYHTFFLPHDAQPGIWIYSVDFMGKSYAHQFEVSEKSPPSSIQDIRLEKLFPNPARQALKLSLEVNQKGEYAFDILDMTGRRMRHIKRTYAKGSYQQKIQVDNFARGIYMLSIRNTTTKEPIVVKRFLKH